MSGPVVGVGFSRRAEAAEIASLVASVLDGRAAAALAMPARLAATAAAREAAALLSLPLLAVAEAAIAAAQPRCLTRPRVAAFSVAEGAALAAAGGAARLLGPRRAGARVTAALADAPPDAAIGA